MRPLRLLTVIGGASLLLAGPAVGASGLQREAPSSSAPSVTSTAIANHIPTRQSLAGVWTYNETDSVNAANGRKEDATVQRRAGNSGAATGHGGGTRPVGPAGGGGTGMGAPGSGNSGYRGFGGGGGGNVSPFQSQVLNESRDLARDLLEIPTALQITVADDAITFVDHLARELTYPTNSKKKKYQVSASVFEAKAYWDGTQFKKEIEGAEGFRMRETYFVSQDGQRLFVIVRVGDQHDKEAPILGVDRVYDRGTRSK